MENKLPEAIRAAEVAPPARPPTYPAPYAGRTEGREKRQLGDFFGLKNFGVNLTRLAPGAVSAMRHAHSLQDELIYVLEGRPTLVTDNGETVLEPGMCAGFKAGTGNAHHIVNRTETDAVFLEIGDRSVDDKVTYPGEDIQARQGSDGRRQYAHKDGTPY